MNCISDNKHTKEDLKAMQNWSLERKIQVTQTRIIEWYQHWEGEVYVSFSGGKDSTVLLDLTRRIYPDIVAVFVDTGLEYPEIKEFARSKENVVVLRPEINFRQVLEEYGYPVISKSVSRAVSDVRKLGVECWAIRSFNGEETGFYNYEKHEHLISSPFKISSKCCDIMKKFPLRKFEKTSNLKAITGTMADESVSRKNAWLLNGCNAFESRKPKSQPMSFWTEQDVLQYIKRFNIPYCSVYGDIVEHIRYTPKKNIPKPTGKLETTGCSRTGCMFCMFGVHLEKEPNRFQMLKHTHPKIYEYCMRKWDDGGLGLSEILDYIGVKY